MKKILCCLMLVCVLISLIGCQTDAEESTPTTETVLRSIPDGTYLDTFEDSASGRTIDYLMFVPEGATENMPLIIFLHGIGAVGSTALNEDNPMIYNARVIYGENFPFLILAPTSNHTSWISKEMPQRLKDLIDYVVMEYGINQDKIIISGHSMGSSGVFRMVQLYGDYFSAAIPVSDPDVSLISPEACLDVPIWAFAGSLEHPISSNLDALIQSISASGGNARYTELMDVKHGNAPEYAFDQELYEWALAQ